MNIAKELHGMWKKIGGELQPPQITIQLESVYTNTTGIYGRFTLSEWSSFSIERQQAIREEWLRSTGYAGGVITNPAYQPQLCTRVSIFVCVHNGSSLAVNVSRPYGENAISEAIDEMWRKVNAYCQASELDALRRKMGEIHRLSACEAV